MLELEVCDKYEKNRNYNYEKLSYFLNLQLMYFFAPVMMYFKPFGWFLAVIVTLVQDSWPFINFFRSFSFPAAVNFPIKEFYCQVKKEPKVVPFFREINICPSIHDLLNTDGFRLPYQVLTYLYFCKFSSGRFSTFSGPKPKVWTDGDRQQTYCTTQSTHNILRFKPCLFQNLYSLDLYQVGWYLVPTISPN